MSVSEGHVKLSVKDEGHVGLSVERLDDLIEPEVLKVTSLGGLRVAPASEAIEYINLLVYGNSGVGKTLLCGTAWDVPEMRPVLVVDVEGGTFTLREKYPQVDVVRVDSWKDMQTVYDALYNGEGGYRTVILDSLSEIQKFSMGQIMTEVKKSDPGRDIEVPGIREWGKNLWQVRAVVRGFRDLPMNALFTALADHNRDTRTGLDKSELGIQGRSRMEIPGFVDFVVYMYMKYHDEQNKRFLLTQQTEKEIAKDRSNKLPKIIEEPTMKLIHSTIFGGNDADPS